MSGFTGLRGKDYEKAEEKKQIKADSNTMESPVKFYLNSTTKLRSNKIFNEFKIRRIKVQM